MRRILLATAVILIGASCLAAAQKWQLQYFYDEDRSSFELNDLQFPSARMGIGVGFLAEESGSNKPAALVTNDGGAHWTVQRLKEPGLSLFFLNDSLGWMVTPKGIWRTEEAGRGWTKISSLKNMLRVWFLTPEHGWAIGFRKSVFETTDGGRKWLPVPAAAEPNSKAEYTVYGWITFAGQEVGLISGWHRAPRPSDTGLPDWLDPEQARHRREVPSMSIILDTRDGGKTWKSSIGSLFGHITRVRLMPGGIGLGLVELTGAMDEWPSEVHLLNWGTGKSQRVFADRNIVVTDIWVTPSGTAYLAGIESPGKLRRVVPGKLRILKSEDRHNWTRMDVDYRATGQRAIFAGSNGDHLWVATDSGMILKLSSGQ